MPPPAQKATAKVVDLYPLALAWEGAALAGLATRGEAERGFYTKRGKRDNLCLEVRPKESGSISLRGLSSAVPEYKPVYVITWRT